MTKASLERSAVCKCSFRCPKVNDDRRSHGFHYSVSHETYSGYALSFVVEGKLPEICLPYEQSPNLNGGEGLSLLVVAATTEPLASLRGLRWSMTACTKAFCNVVWM